MKPEMNALFMDELMNLPAIQESIRRRAMADEKALVDGRMLTLDRIDSISNEMAANARAIEEAREAFQVAYSQKDQALGNLREAERNAALLCASYNSLEKDLHKKYGEQCVIDAVKKLNLRRVAYQDICDLLNSSINRVTQAHVITHPKRKQELRVQLNAAKHMLLAVDSAIPEVESLQRARISPTILNDKIEKILAGIPNTDEGALNG